MGEKYPRIQLPRLVLPTRERWRWTVNLEGKGPLVRVQTSFTKEMKESNSRTSTIDKGLNIGV